jgi:hypothetical protein
MFPRFQDGNFRMAKSSQSANLQNAKRDEVLKRMLKMKPQPHNKSKNLKERQLDFAVSKDSASDISDGNEKRKA